MLLAVVVEDGGGVRYPCSLVGFGVVLCGRCNEPFVGVFRRGDSHTCGAVIVELTAQRPVGEDATVFESR